MISGFQNHLHLLYGLPGGWLDNADILSGAYAKRKKRKDEELEEAIAAQMLLARQKPIELPPQTNVIKLSEILRSKMYTPAPGEITGEERLKRIRYLLLALAMDD